MKDLDHELVPVAGKPGERIDPQTGEVFYSANWLSDAADTVLGRLRVADLPVTLPLVAVLAEADGELDTAETDRLQSAQVIRLQRMTQPADGDIGIRGAARRAAPLNPSGQKLAPPESLDATVFDRQRRLVVDALAAAIRHAEKLEEMYDDEDPLDARIIRERIAAIEQTRTLFGTDPSRSLR